MDRFDAMCAWLYHHKEIERLAGAKMFMDIPDRWFEDPSWRCENGHVSSTFLKSERDGDRCLACHGRVKLTFPEDREGDPPVPIEPPWHFSP